MYGEDYYNRLNERELMHYGIPGMKWGKRKAQPVSVGRTSRPRRDAVSLKATGHKVAAKIFGMNQNVYKKSNPTLSSMNAAAKTDSLNKAKKAQAEANKKRDQKIERKQKLKDTYKDINKKATFGEKLTYNAATRKKAAKYVVDKNMSMAEANKRAKKDAWVNTAIATSAIAALTVAELRRMS